MRAVTTALVAGKALRLIPQATIFMELPYVSYLGIGQLGSIIAQVFFFSLRDKSSSILIIPYSVWTYLPSDSPNYHKGNSLNLGTSCASCLIVIIGGLYIRWENRKRDRGERNYRLEGKTLDDISQLGYLHPKFRYQL